MDAEDDEAGDARLSLPAQATVAVAVVAVAVAVAVHLAMVFLHVAPANTVSKQHDNALREYIYPEFEQNWKLFAPDPLQQNIAVQVRAQIRTPDGGTGFTGWTDLTARDWSAIRHSPLPSHTQQNVLRRAWDFYTGSHDSRERPIGERGLLFERYLRRTVMFRLGPTQDGGTVERIQIRSATTPVAPPPWSDEKIDTKPVYRKLPWWSVTAADLPKGTRR